MSIEFTLVLFAAVPRGADLHELLSELGSVQGDDNDFSVAGTQVFRDTSDAATKRALAAFSKQRKRAAEVVLTMTAPTADSIEVAEALIRRCGGALISEDGKIVFRSTNAPGGGKRPALDVSIPPEVEQKFLGRHFSIAARDFSKVKMAALVARLKEPPARVAYSRSGDCDVKIGTLMLHDRPPFDIPSEIGVGAKPAKFLFTQFEYWHVKTAAPQDWRAMLAVACGFARATRGVIWRRDISTSGTSVIAHDFAS